jgi:hypothetical protein
MAATPIHILKANISREQARRAFSAPKFPKLYWRVTRGPLQRIAEIYVPFSVYTVGYAMNHARIKRVFGMDAVNGSLDLFEFPRIPEADQLLRVVAPNVIPASLSESRGQEILRDKVLRLVFQQGFFKFRDPRLVITREPAIVHIPYWLGFYGRAFLKCRALDAVRQRFEGAKASAFFEEWLSA